MNRGSPRASRTPSESSASFNEAPIHESGKFSKAGNTRYRETRFNEAPIHESGKYLRTQSTPWAPI